MENVLPPLDDGEVYTIFREIAKTGKLIGIHAENFWLIKELTTEVMATDERDYNAVLKSRPAVSEITVIETAIAFAKATGAHLHILHLATGDGVEIIRRAQKDGINVTAETCPHYLFLTDKDFDRVGAQIKGYPPVRTQRDQDLLWEGLKDGTLSFVVTDHAPHTPEEKMKNYWEAPAGMAAIETASMLMLTAVNEGRITLNQVAAWMSENVAKMFDYYPLKGSLQVGTDADFAIVDLDQEYIFDQSTMHSRTKLSPYNGMKMKGRVVQTILRGITTSKDGDIVGDPQGKWVRPLK
jgi:dihydroorotase (multifunctional complex type)